MRAAPRSGPLVRRTRDWICRRSRSVASSSSVRLRVRSSASAGLRQTIEPLAREVGAADLGHVALVEQRQLQGAVVGGQRLNGRRP